MPTAPSSHRVHQAVGRSLERVRGPLVLAVSGGVDSMVLLHAASRHPALKTRCTVATFDHATGPAATRAARLVRETARALGMDVVSGRARSRGGSEAEWRAMRWSFLRSAAARRRATIVTAHTLNDQVETVVMRLLRGASARGLAGLHATSSIVRPLLGTGRRAIEQYARTHAIEFVDDPTNASRKFLRNRVRLDLLPAIRAVRPTFEGEMLNLSTRAAAVRRKTERLALSFLVDGDREPLKISMSALQGLSPEALAQLWPAIVAQLGVPLDRRGVERATSFTLRSTSGQQAQCGGGITLERAASMILVSRGKQQSPATVEFGSRVEFGQWRLRRVSKATFESHETKSGSAWAIAIEHPELLSVRRWQPGDRVKASAQAPARRVKRYFSELAIPVSERKNWPVVVGEGAEGEREVLWVPGVCRAAPRSEHLGHPLTYMICERRAG